MRTILYALGVFTLGLGPVNLSAKIVVQAWEGVGSCPEAAAQSQAVQAFQRATQYLEQVPRARKMMARLKASAVQYEVRVVNLDKPAPDPKIAEFDGAINIIWWDPRAGLEWKRNAFASDAHSAAIALLHEFGHAYHKDLDSRKYWRCLRHRTNDEWGNLEERETILGIENPVAKALGEAERNFHEDTGFYEAHPYQACGPTTIHHARVKKRLFQALF